MVMNRVKNGNISQAMRWGNAHPRCTQYISTKSTTHCPISFAQKCGFVLYIGEIKGNNFTIMY
jgi:hypothetical protein